MSFPVPHSPQCDFPLHYHLPYLAGKGLRLWWWGRKELELEVGAGAGGWKEAPILQTGYS